MRPSVQQLIPCILAILAIGIVACEGASARPASIAVPAQPPPPSPPTSSTTHVSEATDASANASLPAAPIAEGPRPPAKRPIDASFKVDGAGLLLGITSTEIWYLLSDGYTVVIDRATGCAVEGYPEPPILATLKTSKDPAITESEIARPEVLAAIRDVVGLGRRLGARGHPYMLDMVWSPDGRHIFFESNDLLYQSSDGGRSFARFDDFYSSRLAMSADGKHLVYERCIDVVNCPSCSKNYGPGCNTGRHYVSLPMDGSRKPSPLPFTTRQTHLLEMRASGEAMFSRSEVEVCLDTFELGKGDPSRASSTCVPFPKKATGSWPMREWEAISPSGRYGIVKWEEGRPNLVGAIALTYVVSLVDVTTKQIVKTVTDVRGDVDDDGNMVMQSMNEGGGDHTYFYPLKGPRKLLGNHYLMAWHDKTAVLGVHRVAPLGARKCDLVKSVKTPP